MRHSCLPFAYVSFMVVAWRSG